ncbi:hypothetical protein IP86_17590 [Rhodopseudomonas sp. AAP120]|uniref:hypothetical protein n=1 Tax=Rhodopseudomonas TaxID=1073 RepID=UPI000164BE27|nr:MULTISPECIES: hypothetical protein [Rhodopseudomonas]ACE99677.1 conserved hypothetical protein [Rhodopseudomonas palustris TIE-1]KPF96220.1 hypothetical protein IP86_17590 [Rhodopseudomonas sp. AAP120]
MHDVATNDLPLTVHSRARLQQRAIPALVVDLLMQFGSPFRANGAERLMFDKTAIKRLRHHLGGDRGLKVVERWLGVYAVVGDNGLLVTAAHKQERFRRR